MGRRETAPTFAQVQGVAAFASLALALVVALVAGSGCRTPQASGDSAALNPGLVAVGRVAADSFDARGRGVDTLGGMGSGMTFDAATWSRSDDARRGITYRGTLRAVSDRGFGDGSQDYLPRIHTFTIAVTPRSRGHAGGAGRITLTLSDSSVLTRDGIPFTGFDAGDSTSVDYPRSPTNSPGGGRASLDPEGVALLADGGFFVSDEYGPFVHRFDPGGRLQATLRPPPAFIPHRGPFPGGVAFTATNPPTSGRRNNRGFEGLSLSPDQGRLLVMLQSPLVQDGGVNDRAGNTRLLIFDVERGSPTEGRAVGEFVYPLAPQDSTPASRSTVASEILALNRRQFLVLERDSGRGLGSGTNLPSVFKRIALATIDGASNILGGPYDLERGAPGQLGLPVEGLPAGIAPIRRTDLVDLLEPRELARFGLNNRARSDRNTLPEKWESLALMPLGDPAAPDDFLLLVMSDNDFKASEVYHNGRLVGRNPVAVDTLIFAYRVRLPMFDSDAMRGPGPGR